MSLEEPVAATTTTILTIVLNGERRQAEIDPRMLLVEALRDSFGMIGPKIGCLSGDCGACTVRVAGEIQKSCLRLALSAEGADIRTLEGVSGEGPLTALQQAFWDEAAFQCGFCLSGMIFAAEDLLDRNTTPDESEIRTALIGNLCRCTGYEHIVNAVRAASEQTRSDSL